MQAVCATLKDSCFNEAVAVQRRRDAIGEVLAQLEEASMKPSLFSDGEALLHSFHLIDTGGSPLQ